MLNQISVMGSWAIKVLPELDYTYKVRSSTVSSILTLYNSRMLTYPIGNPLLPFLALSRMPLRLTTQPQFLLLCKNSHIILPSSDKIWLNVWSLKCKQVWDDNARENYAQQPWTQLQVYSSFTYSTFAVGPDFNNNAGRLSASLNAQHC